MKDYIAHSIPTMNIDISVKNNVSVAHYLALFFCWRCKLGWGVKKSTLFTAITCENMYQLCTSLPSSTNLWNG
jgi:hypothetical protein